MDRNDVTAELDKPLSRELLVHLDRVGDDGSSSEVNVRYRLAGRG